VNKRKRRKSRRAKRGLYKSMKSGLTYKFRSSWECKYMLYLDLAEHVKQWWYEPFPIKYVSNIKTGKMRRYYPDFLVEMNIGTKELIEIKPSTKINKIQVIKKTLAAREWCSKNDITFSIVTEKELKILELL